MAKRSKKHQQLLDAGRELFWKHGIRRVSVEEICDKAGASKMTFYRHFENKADLAKSLMDDLFENSIRKQKELMDSDIPFEEKIGEILKAKQEGSKDLSPEFLEDVYKHDELGLRSYFEEIRQKLLIQVLHDYKNAQAKGDIRSDFKVEMIPFLSHMYSEIALNPQVQAMFPDLAEMNLELTKLFFYGIANRDK